MLKQGPVFLLSFIILQPGRKPFAAAGLCHINIELPCPGCLLTVFGKSCMLNSEKEKAKAVKTGGTLCKPAGF